LTDPSPPSPYTPLFLSVVSALSDPVMPAQTPLAPVVPSPSPLLACATARRGLTLTGPRVHRAVHRTRPGPPAPRSPTPELPRVSGPPILVTPGMTSIFLVPTTVPTGRPPFCPRSPLPPRPARSPALTGSPTGTAAPGRSRGPS